MNIEVLFPVLQMGEVTAHGGDLAVECGSSLGVGTVTSC